MAVGKHLTFIDFFNLFHKHAEIIPGWKSLELTSQLETIVGLWKFSPRNSENVSQKIPDHRIVQIYIAAFFNKCKIDKKNIGNICDFISLTELIKCDYMNRNDIDLDIQTKGVFQMSCEEGRIDLAQWLHSLGGIDIHYADDMAFRATCENGHINIAKWLYSFGSVDIHVYNDISFWRTCVNGHVELAKWLYSLGDIDIHADGDMFFRLSCSYGRIEVAKWLYSLGDVDIHSYNDNAFFSSCKFGHIQVAKWLYSLGGIDIHVDTNNSLEVAFINGHINIIEWLSNLNLYDADMLRDLSEAYKNSKCVDWTQVYLKSLNDAEKMDNLEMENLRNANEKLTKDIQFLRDELDEAKRKLIEINKIITNV